MMSEKTLRELPKVELHRHMEGSIRPATAWDLAARNGLDWGFATYDEFAEKACVKSPMKSLAEVLNSLSLARRALCSREAVERVAFENVEDAWKDGTKLLELRFAPTLIAASSGLLYEEIIEATLEGIVRAMSSYPLEVGLIASLRRKAPPEENENVFDALLREIDRHGTDRLVGVDLSDDERSSDPAIFVPLMDRAKKAGLGVTVHSGLNTSSEYVRKTLRLLEPERIGHGILILGDDDLLKEIIDKNILLEISLTSNWITASVPSLEEHPFPILAKAGIPVCLNSDDPHSFGIDLVNEYDIAQGLFGFGEGDFLAMNRTALAASFLPEHTRESLRKQYFE